ncbi:MAG: hypothetical protein SCH71_02775 [Desulfobulbaceae bacterium]|nr:hypothetical protein [Desulfobulbaceae bacterium]
MKSNEYKGDWMVAAAFAEAGEWDTARSMMPERKSNTEISWLSRIFSAVAFAEEGLADEAIRLTGGKRQQPTYVFGELEGLGLPMIHLRYGTVCID